ncbi:FixH family protein [Fulvivirgaceae bacterium LMO-SS25]|tara:strand:- start:142 stop:582 length:441 start_codon:yes stop_codon:yes gene_type:complete
MSWGWRIALLYIGFVVFIITLVVITFQYDVNLVAKDYYAQELKFQTQIDSNNNLQALDEKAALNYRKADAILELQLPPASLAMDTKGVVQFFRPSDGKFDFQLTFDQTDGDVLKYNTKEILAGYWRVKVSWNSEGKDYYFEEKIVL